MYGKRKVSRPGELAAGGAAALPGCALPALASLSQGGEVRSEKAACLTCGIWLVMAFLIEMEGSIHNGEGGQDGRNL